MTLIVDNTASTTTIDVNCDWPGCGEYISDMVGIGYTDEHKLYERTLLRMAAQMKDTATNLGWQILSSFADKNNTDLCRQHFVRQQMTPTQNNDWTMVAHNATRTGTGKTYIPPTD